jgi:hypothetical protein
MRKAKRKYDKPRITDGLGDCLCGLLQQQKTGPTLEFRVEDKVLPSVEPDTVKKETPRHHVRALPN